MAALLDYSKFGITKEELSSFDYIFGYDLGHGEVSVSFKRVSDSILGTEKKVKLVPNSHAEKVYSALAKRSNDNWELVNPFERIPNAELYIGFKRKPRLLISGEKYPGKDITCKELMVKFTKILFESIIKTNNADSDHSKDFSGKGLLVVGCPSDPKEWTSFGLDVEYQKIIQSAVDGIGLNLKVVVMPESRASLLKVYKLNMAEKKDDVTISEYMKRGIVVFDFGSSTLDSTSININTNVQKDDSIPLGASLLEKRIMSLSKEQREWKDSDLANRDKSELEVRKAKEDYYTYENEDEDPPKLRLEKKNWEEIKIVLRKRNDSSLPADIQQVTMEQLINSEVVSYNTIQDGEISGTWYSLSESFIKATIAKWKRVNEGEEFMGLVLITGGASRMLFVQDMIKQHFQNAYVYADPEPSFCVSQGLVIAADTDIKAIKHLETLYEKINEEIKKNIPICYKIVAKQCEEPIYNHIKSNIDIWVTQQDNSTLNLLAKDISNSFTPEIVNNAIEKAVQVFINGESDSDIEGFKNVIASSVNDIFSKEFPGISQNVPPFVLNNKLITDIRLELQKLTIIKPEHLIAAFLDYISWWALIENFLSLFVGGKVWHNKKLSLSEKEKFKNWFSQDKAKRLRSCSDNINESLNNDLKTYLSNLNKTKAEESITKTLIEVLNKQIRPFVDEMVNHVSLYF